MEIFKDMLEMWKEASFTLMDDDWLSYVMLIFAWIFNLMIIVLIYAFIIRPILYKKRYSSLKFDYNVEVTDKKIVTNTTTTYIQSGKVMVPMTTTTTYHYVYLKGDIIDQRIDSEYYYDILKAGDKVKVDYKEIYETLRFSTVESWKFIGNDIEEIRL